MRVILRTGLLQLGFIVATACKETVLCDPVKVFVKRVLTVLPFCIIDAAKLLCTSLKKYFAVDKSRIRNFFSTSNCKVKPQLLLYRIKTLFQFTFVKLHQVL